MATVQVTKEVSRADIERIKKKVREVVTDNAAVLFTQGHSWDTRYPETMPQWVTLAKLDLQDAGFRVIIPQMTDPWAPSATVWTSQTKDIILKEYGIPGKELIMAGASLGGLNNYLVIGSLPLGTVIGGSITVGTPYTSKWSLLQSFFEPGLKYEAIRKRVLTIDAIHSRDDHTVDFPDVFQYARLLRFNPIIEHRMGHYGRKDTHVVENKQFVYAVLKQYLKAMAKE